MLLGSHDDLNVKFQDLQAFFCDDCKLSIDMEKIYRPWIV